MKKRTQNYSFLGSDAVYSCFQRACCLGFQIPSTRSQQFPPETVVFAIQITGRHDSRGRSVRITPILTAVQFRFSCSSHTVSPGRPSASSASSIRAFSVHSLSYFTHHATAVLHAPPALQLQKFTFSLQSVFIYMYKKHSFLYQLIGVCNGDAVYFS